MYKSKYPSLIEFLITDTDLILKEGALKKVDLLIDKDLEQLNIGSVSTRFLTVKQLYNACIENDYILVRFPSGRQMGVNTKVASLIFKKKEYKDNQSTDFVSYLPCSFSDYISKKHVFM